MTTGSGRSKIYPILLRLTDAEPCVLSITHFLYKIVDLNPSRTLFTYRPCWTPEEIGRPRYLSFLTRRQNCGNSGPSAAGVPPSRSTIPVVHELRGV